MNRRLLAIGAAVVAGVVALALVLPTLNVLDSPFSAYGTGDQDTSDLVGGLRTQGYEISSMTLGPNALTGVDASRTDAFYLAVGVDRGYTQPELNRLTDFVRAGGTAIVLDDTGASDALLERLGLEQGDLLLSTTGDQPSVVKVEVDGNIVNLWEPTEIVVTDDADVTVLAHADNTTAKDTNENQQVDREEPTCAGGCPVAVHADLGQGSVYVVSDATFATNKYATSSGSIQLVSSLAQEQTSGRRAQLIVDESRHVAGPAELGLTVFRLGTIPLGLPAVPYAAAGLVAAAAVVNALRRDQAAWPEHDPRLDEPYLEPVEDQEDEQP